MNVESHLETIRRIADRIGRPVRIMEVCGTHTTAAFRSGLRALLPGNIKLLSGPGCPVCVTPCEFVDRAIALARSRNETIATFGDFVRVPGTNSSLEIERAKGAEVTVAYSAQDALEKAASRPGRKLVFLGVGFETTAPTVAWAIRKAARDGTANFLVLSAHKTMPRAMAALLDGKDARIDGFLCPGHVSAIIGSQPYNFIPRRHHKPCVIAGFEPSDMIAAIALLLKQLDENRAEVENQYKRGVSARGNRQALALMREVFEECDVEWRGLGAIPGSGLRIRKTFRAHDADELCPDLELPPPSDSAGCMCGDILRGTGTPPECPLFKTKCSPFSPVGACMVSGEGTCAAYYKYWKPET